MLAPATSTPGGENRSTNRSFGTGPDFDMDTIFIDQAYVELAVPKRFLPEGMTLKNITGKQANPFLWKNGKDILIWDNDITPEGLAFQLAGLPTDQLSLFGNAGYFISDENSGSQDPHVMGLQGGLGFLPVEDIDTGLRVSFYRWGSDTSDFQAAPTARRLSNFDSPEIAPQRLQRDGGGRLRALQVHRDWPSSLRHFAQTWTPRAFLERATDTAWARRRGGDKAARMLGPAIRRVELLTGAVTDRTSSTASLIARAGLYLDGSSSRIPRST